MKHFSQFLVEYIQFIQGHKNSKGENAPWVIKSHKTNKILSSHKTKEEAKEHLKNMHVFGEGETEIVEESLMEIWKRLSMRNY